MEHVKHEIAPVYDKNSEILILGSFPSVKSRETDFFYGHPKNRFWKVLSALYQNPLPETTEDKKELLLNNHIALWDVIASCDIKGSSDSSIKNVKPNDFSAIFQTADIRTVYTNGATAFKLYRKYCLAKTGLEAVLLPSTSPANAACSLECLIEKWNVIRITP